MNGFDHLALWYGIMGIGAICHTINPRLHDEQIVYIANHAGDRLLFADAAFSDIVARIVPRCPVIERVVLIERQGSYASLDMFLRGSTEERRGGGWGARKVG